MTADSTANPGDPSAIEADLERERARLADSIDALRSHLTPSALADDGLAYLKGHLGPLVRSCDQVVRENPLAAALVGIGLAWLLLGRSGPVGQAPTTQGELLAGTKYEALSRWEDEGGNAAPLPEPALNWVAETDKLRKAAHAALRKIDKGLADRLLDASEADRQRKDIHDGLRRDGNIALRRGLEQLSTAVQDRIAAARETAYLAGGRMAHRGARMVDDRPLICGAAAFAVGAAVGASLPNTVTENRVFGTERDRLMHEAEELLRREKARAAAVLGEFVGTVGEEVKATAADLVGTAA